MTARDLSPFLRRLNDHCARALTGAASLCETRAHRDIEVEHWLIKLLELGDGDLLAILRRYELDVDGIWNGLLAAIDRLPHDLRGKPGLSQRLGQWLEAAWMRASLEAAAPGGSTSIRSAHLLAALAETPHLLRAPGAWPLLSVSAIQIERLMHELDNISTEAAAPDAGEPARPAPGPLSPAPVTSTPARPMPGQADTSALARFTTDITRKARDGKIDPVFGRDVEIRQMVDILARRRKNNPILVGEPGVGKTALVEGLALKIAEGDVPVVIQNVSVLTLDLGLLQAGAGVKGEFEQRLKNVIEAVQQSPTPVLLFIDEAHTLIGAGNTAGGADAANLLKPALARGELRTIAATTWSEYKQYFERDAALERRFQMVKVEEPDDDSACLMLRGLKGRYARHHGVHITDAAIAAAVRLSRRYLTGRQLPDKAVDLLDTAAARVRMSLEATPVAISAGEAERAALEVERTALLQDQGTTGADVGKRLAAIGARLDALAIELEQFARAFAEQKGAAETLIALRAQWQAAADESARRDLAPSIRAAREMLARHGGQAALIHAEVDETAIAQVIADWTGVPVNNLLSSELATLLELERRLGHVVVGQDEALAALSKSLRAAKAGLKFEEAPLGVFLLVGPSGVGKTESARALADLMFGGERSLVTINLSEYQEAHTVSQLKGSPPGYVGYGAGGVLTEAVRQRPYSVILLDEVEKAHRDVLNLFYQVFDRGFMRDGEGRVIDFRNTVILMTSNLGSEQILAATDAAVAAGAELANGMLMEAIRPTLVDHFQPALLARFQTIVYRPLSADAMALIVRMKLGKVADRIARRFGVPLRCDDTLVAELVRACLLPDSGARNIDSLLDQQILPVLSRELLARMAGQQTLSSIRLSFSEDDGIGLDFEELAMTTGARA
ncbi:Chaperone ClpB [Cupriavidus basilensis OR16]|uniref:Chaperone ClpB n=1 Tax=Cupriavidus basilensis OR16 TaxID=1127483 RepID=H1SB98_9BURK|nr:type VI secretion system ATPase TssH [Cupriavidus basilensis]EHP40169.1 Chaperone ClpB [Cupriavidus basilensis OR16]